MSLLSARETAYQTIRSRIITMELKPGDPLNDRELAEELGISRTPMREALLMLNLARMVDIKPQSGTHVAPINLKLMEMEQFARYTLEKEILNRLRGFELCGMEHHFDHMLASLQHVERIRKFSLLTEENKSVCSSHTAILEALLHGSADDVSEALESHLSRYKQSVAQARSVHPEYFIDE